MNRRLSILMLVTYCVIIGTVLFSSFGNKAFSEDNDPHMTGLPELTHEEIEWQNKHMIRVKKVKLNKLGLERINKWQKKIGQRQLTENELEIVSEGDEIEGILGTTDIKGISGFTEDADSPLIPFPPYVDNSALKYFPPIRSQGSLPSCGCFSGTYYVMTYMYALAHDLDAKTGGDDYRLSPKWTYNMLNGGEKNGVWYYNGYEIGQKHGSATWAEFPYNSDYRAWCLDTPVWYNAIYRRFDQYGYVDNTNLDSGIDQIKQLLMNGYILNIPTYINSWQYKSIGNDPDTAEDDPFVGKKCCYWVNGKEGYHAMTVVGYNDHIWVDVNGNGIVDSGEKGAFRIANSWGTGWIEEGFCWMSYDALKNPSAVEDGPSVNRIYGWFPSRAHWVTARYAYEPVIVAEFTVNHLKRNQLRITLGISDESYSTPTTIWYPKMISLQGGPYAFNGTTTPCDGTFVFDFTDILPSSSEQSHYYIGIYDSALGDEAVLKNYKIIDLFNSGIEATCYDLPIISDAEQIYAWIDYDFDNGNMLPVALAAADPVSGQAPLQVTFNDAGSYDPDGEIISFNWDFGDGVTSSGVIVDHLYELPGSYVATLTVTDNLGGIEKASVTLEVQFDQNRAVHVEDISISLISVPGGISAQAEVTIVDLHGTPMAGVTVAGEWGGIVNASVSGITDSNGIATFISNKTKKTGIITFTVTDVLAAGYLYDANQNIETQDYISTDEPVNQKPVAEAKASPSSGVAPLCVYFTGADSYDTDGQIVSYEWDFGDGGKAAEQTVSYIYSSPGVYEAVLTITDDQGETDSASVLINVTSEYIPLIFIYDITMSVIPVPGGYSAQAEVTVSAQNGFIMNATVEGQWSGLNSDSVTENTDAEGKAVFLSDKTKKQGEFIFTVTNVFAEGYIYDPSKNNETSDSIPNI